MSKAKKYYNLISVNPGGYLSEIGSHRYGLLFQSKRQRGGKSAAIIQLNGSISGPTGNVDNWIIDPTIGKVLTWCYENDESKFDLVHCLNLFSYVNPYPTELAEFSLEMLNHPDNDVWIKEVCKNVDNIILGYGDCDGISPDVASNRVNEVLSWFEDKELYRVGFPTKNGKPQHGRRWNNSPSLQIHRGAIR